MGDVVAGDAHWHWLCEHAPCKTNVGTLDCLCSHYCKTVRDHGYAIDEISCIFEMNARKEHTTGAFLGAMGRCVGTG